MGAVVFKWPFSLLRSLWTSFDERRTSQKSDVAIVGGGIVGASLAYHLSHTSLSTTLWDTSSLGSGASGLSAGTLYATGHFDETSILESIENNTTLTDRLDPNQTQDLDAVLVSSTIKSVRQLEESGYDCGLVECGALTLINSPMSPELRAEYWDLRRRHHDIHLLTPRQTRAIEPAIRDPSLWSFHTPKSAYVDPLLTVRAFADSAVAKGRVTVIEDTNVTQIVPHQTNGGYILTMNNGTTHEARQVVLCTGAYGHTLVKDMCTSNEITEEDRITPVKGTMWTMDHTHQTQGLSHVLYTTASNEHWRHHKTVPPRCTHNKEGDYCIDHVYGRPFQDNFSIFGGGRIPTNRPVDYNPDLEVIEKGSNILENKLYLLKDELSTDIPCWSGCMPFSESGRPVVKEIKEGLWIVNGLGAKGMMLGPGITKWLTKALE